MKRKMEMNKLIIATGIALLLTSCAAKYRTIHEKGGAQTPESSDQVGIPNEPVTVNENEDDFVITANPVVIFEGETVAFTGDCGEGVNKVITWNFGDDETGEGTSVSHTYPVKGTYTVVAECEEPEVETKTEQVKITVKEKDDPSSDGSDNNNDGGEDTNVDGTDNSGDDTGSDDTGTDGSIPDNDGSGQDDSGTDDSGTDSNDGTDNSGTDDSGNDDSGTDGSGTDGSHDGLDGSDDDGDDGLDDGPGGPNNPGQNPGQSPFQGKLK